MYRSILEFDDALYEETAWFCLAVVRCSIVLKIEGVLTRMVRDLL